ncbi:glucose-1-phosphate thymidylyltransferase [Thermogladius sp.]|uniref:glucose-1-phosphate thymidylyltransferase n=1 Tax=Thermogladius sp. TaxID=2023064 RepID=UPI003D110B7E
MKGLVLAAGEGSRLRPFTYSRPKHLIPLLGKPMVQYPIEDLVSAGVVDIGVVVGYYGDLVRGSLGDGSRLGARLTYITQEKRLGIAHAIYRAVEEGFLDGPFVVYLGDNIVEEGVAGFAREFAENGSDVHILLSEVEDPGRFGVAVLDSGRVVKLVEKPREPVSNLAVVGVYFFRDPELVARAFKDLRPSWRGEYEVTELVQWFVDRGYRVTYSKIKGWWKDVGTYEGLLDAVYMLLDRLRGSVEGEVDGEVRGRAVVEEGAVVEGRVYGPAYIGRGAVVSKGSAVEPYTSLEEGVRASSGRVARSLVMEYSELDLGRARLVDSVLGSRTRVRNTRELHGDIRLVVSDNSLVEI